MDRQIHIGSNLNLFNCVHGKNRTGLFGHWMVQIAKMSRFNKMFSAKKPQCGLFYILNRKIKNSQVNPQSASQPTI